MQYRGRVEQQEAGALEVGEQLGQGLHEAALVERGDRRLRKAAVAVGGEAALGE